MIIVMLAGSTTALVTAGSAFGAFSSTVYPTAGDSLSASSSAITVTDNKLGLDMACTVSGGAFPIGAHNSAGPVTMTYSTRPSFTNCKQGNINGTITTSGSWTVAAQYGQSTGTVTAPANGILISWGGCTWVDDINESPVTLTGGWNNGFSTPTSVSTVLEFGGTIPVNGSCTGNGTVTFSNVLETLTDTTQPSKLPLLGP